MKRTALIAICLVACITAYAQVRAGVARMNITPDTPVWLAGYASRNKPSTEVSQALWAKALVIEENKDSRIIIVATDLLGLTHEVSEIVAQRVGEKYGINRSQLLLNSSHTHSGPVIWPSLSVMYDLSPEDRQALAAYSRKLTDAIVNVIDTAMSNLAPVQLSCGHGSADFAINRREFTDKGVKIGVSKEGPVDHDVPVLKIASPDGKLKAVLFGYACHNTTTNTYLVNGDYAGFAQAELESRYPGTVAIFLAGCGADQNPNPRGTMEMSMQHGVSLANAVQKVLGENLNPVRPPIRSDFMITELEFPPFNPDNYRKELFSDDRFRQRRAALMLEAYNKGWNTDRIPYPVQVVRFSNDMTILALSGEVVVDYSLETKRRYPHENLFVSGYCTEVLCYIPTRRILLEGGYEPDNSMIYYGLPGPFTENVEEIIFSAISRVMRNTGAKPSIR